MCIFSFVLTSHKITNSGFRKMIKSSSHKIAKPSFHKMTKPDSHKIANSNFKSSSDKLVKSIPFNVFSRDA